MFRGHVPFRFVASGLVFRGHVPFRFAASGTCPPFLCFNTDHSAKSFVKCHRLRFFQFPLCQAQLARSGRTEVASA